MIETQISKLINGKNSSETYDLDMLSEQIHLLYDFCDSSGLDFERICNNHINTESSDSSNLAAALHQTEAKVIINEYYSTNTQYLIELTMHECSWNYKKIFLSIAEFARKREIKSVLDYGGGVGGLSICLGKQGIRCDYADVMGQTWNYAGYRFHKEGLNVAQYTEDSLSKKSGSYDLIVSIDCLEHLKNLSEYINLFNSLLRNEGLLLVRSSFFGGGLHLRSNHKYNSINVFNEMLADNGFVFVGQLVTRIERSFVIPNCILKLLKKRPSSGRSLIYKRKVKSK